MPARAFSESPLPLSTISTRLMVRKIATGSLTPDSTSRVWRGRWGSRIPPWRSDMKVAAASVELQRQLHESEVEKHQLSTKVTMLQEELVNYKAYMKSTVLKYKNEIEILRHASA